MATNSKGRGEGPRGYINMWNFSSSQWVTEGEEILYKFYKLRNRQNYRIDSITIVTTIKYKNC